MSNETTNLIAKVAAVISAFSLVISACSFYVSYLSYRSGALPPVVSTRLNNFTLTDNPVSVSASFVFSVSNISSRPIFIAKCEVATDGLNSGAGGYSERFSPCGIGQFEISGGFELASGKTEFFTVKHAQVLDSYDPSLALNLMGIDLDAIRSRLATGPCIALFSADRMSSGMSQNCSLRQSSIDSFPSHTPSQKVFVLVLQTGTGDLIRTPLYLSQTQLWPWGS